MEKYDQPPPYEKIDSELTSNVATVQILTMLENGIFTFDQFLDRTSKFDRIGRFAKCIYCVMLINPFFWCVLPTMLKALEENDKVR